MPCHAMNEQICILRERVKKGLLKRRTLLGSPIHQECSKKAMHHLMHLRWITFYLAILGVITVVFNFVHLSMLYRDKTWVENGLNEWPRGRFYTRHIHMTDDLYSIQIVISALTIATLYQSIQFYRIRFSYKKERSIVPLTARVWENELSSLVSEFIFLLIHPFPGIYWLFPFKKYILVATSMIVYLRLFYLIRCALYRIPNPSQTGDFTEKTLLLRFGPELNLKRLVNSHPGIAFFGSLSFLIVISSYILWILEGLFVPCTIYPNEETYVLPEESCKDMQLIDALWLNALSTTTIGYGDHIPRSNSGRLIVAFVGACGVSLNALAISLVLRRFQWQRSESRVIHFLKKNEIVEKTNELRIKIAQSLFRFYVARQNATTWLPSILCEDMHYRTISDRLPREQHLKDTISAYRHSKALMRRTNVNGDALNGPMDRLEAIECNLGILRQKLKEIEIATTHYLRERQSATNDMANSTLPKSGLNSPNRTTQMQTDVLAQPWKQICSDISATMSDISMRMDAILKEKTT